MDVSGVLRFASEKGLALDGFDVHNMFPSNTNWRELEGASDAASPTWLLLHLQLRRYTLSVIHKLIFMYSTAPHIWRSPFSFLFRQFSQQPEDPLHYEERACSKQELQQFTNGPECIAVVLKFNEVSVPSLGDAPEVRKLVDGTIIEPTKEEVDAYNRQCEMRIELYRRYHQEALDDLFERMCDITEWAILTPTIKKIIIFEKTGIFTQHQGSSHEALQNRVATIAPTLQRDVLCGFAGSPIIGGDVNVIWADESRLPDVGPDLFLTVDGNTHGFPFQSLSDAQVFVPTRRQLLEKDGLQLLDFIEAIKFYSSKATTEN